jgi:hypothetical protein
MIVLAHACAGADALPHADPADGSVTTPDGGDDIDSGGEGGVDQQPDASPTADGGPTDGAADGEACSLLGSGLLSFRWSARPGDDEVAAVASTRGGQVYALHIDDNQEAHVSRLEDDGTIQWKKSFLGQRDFDAGSGYVMPAGVASDSLGRVVIVGTFQRTVSFAGELRSAAPAGNRTPQAIFAMRLNEDGTTSYLETFDGVDLSAVGVAIDTSNRVWIAGNVSGSVNLGGSDLTSQAEDGFLLQLGEDGTHLFSRMLGSPARDRIAGITIGPQDGPVIAGAMRGPSDLAMEDAGAKRGMYVASFDESGALAWSNFPQPLDREWDKVNALAASPDQVVVLGQYQSDDSPVDWGGGTLPAAETGPPVTFVVQLGSAGQVLHARTFGRDPAVTVTHDPSVVLRAAAIDGAGNVAVVGSLYRGADFGLGVIPKTLSARGEYFPLFLRFDGDLNTISSRAIGGCEFAGGHMLTASLDGAGDLIVGGSIAGEVDLSRAFGGSGAPSAVLFSIAP